MMMDLLGWIQNSHTIDNFGNGRSSGYMARKLYQPAKTKRKSTSAPLILVFGPFWHGTRPHKVCWNLQYCALSLCGLLITYKILFLFNKNPTRSRLLWWKRHSAHNPAATCPWRSNITHPPGTCTTTRQVPSCTGTYTPTGAQPDQRGPQESSVVAAEDVWCGDHPSVQFTFHGCKKEEKVEQAHGTAL